MYQDKFKGSLGIFTSIDEFLREIITTSLNSNLVFYVGVILQIASASFMMWLFFKAYLILLGQSREPLQEIITQLIATLLIIGLATSPEWLNIIIVGVKGLKDGLVSGEAIGYGEILDSITSHKVEVIYKIIKNMSIINIGSIVVGVINVIILIISLIILQVLYFVNLVINDLAFETLLYIAPLAIFCLTYKSFKNIFYSWLSMLISKMLFVVFILMYINIQHRAEQMMTYNNNYAEILYGVFCIVMTAIGWDLINLAKEKSRNLASVSADGVGVGISGSAMRLLGSGMRNLVKFIRR